ncbi:facilitated trehalose transporter Tret1 [Tribolium castaneum]|uniref:Facilitated trehalose transporter Tret1-2 homolog-like Protein n=1 Tax=Tribolium castaneum TaxID=7070 RepID=D6X030_TRICA|nr:PREDICTED: facilitated trehalose transporter Tret1 [Tribolium castaneum]XP_015838543.1 PREDICTED: facilitated trehalose transporter Tret1 [Tribolium castaneum]EFA10057.1 Facilitated trehalose transporter Tret1-2 homolog-like Protein [Tribolium castaneum]|eukprot:XP_015838542.1 PREDICTED: facilitated trehalose transporter Tret1 [Tribolium castaneum]
MQTRNLFQGSKYVYLSAMSANIAAFMTGCSSAWSSPIIPKLLTDDWDQNPLGRVITKIEISWVGSLSSFGAVFGAVLVGLVTQKIGRKFTNILVMTLFLVAFLTAAFTPLIEILYIARILMGSACGGLFYACHVYNTEIAEDANRGILMSSSGLLLVLGIVFTYSVGPFVSIMLYNLILVGICVVYFPIFCYFAPESPYHLIQKRQEAEAFKSLYYLRRLPDNKIDELIAQIKSQLESKEEGSFLDIFKTRGSIKAFFCASSLVIFTQLSGINVFYSYMQVIFNATQSSVPPEICPIIISIVQLLSSSVSTLLCDRLGRRTLLLISASGSAFFEVVLGLYFYLQNGGQDVSALGWLPITSLVGFMLFYKFGIGTFAWPMSSELLPPKVLAKATLLLTTIFWCLGCLLTLFFNPLSDAVGMAGSFWLFAGCCSVFAVITFFFIFETKGKSFDQIQAVFNK